MILVARKITKDGQFIQSTKGANKNQRVKIAESIKATRKSKSKSSFKGSKPVKATKPKSEKKTKKTKQPKAIYDNPYKLSQIYRQVAWQLNTAYDEVRDAGYTSNNIRLFEKTLEMFYEKYNLKVANKHHISIQKHMSMEAVEELSKITLHFADIATIDRAFFLDDITKGLKTEDKQSIQDAQQKAILEGSDTAIVDGVEIPWDSFDVDKFSHIQELYDVDNVQDFIDWTDEMERYRRNSFLQTVLTSDQIADIFSQAIDAGNENSLANLDIEEIEKMAYREYKNNGGLEGDDLRKAVLNRIATARSGKMTRSYNNNFKKIQYRGR